MKETRWLGVLVIAMLGSGLAQADFVGFGDFSDFSVNKADGASGPELIGDTIRITNQAVHESRSVFHLQRQNVTQFEASYTYRFVGDTPIGIGFGAAFVLQNAANGPMTVAAPDVSGVATNFGYTDFFGTFHPSIGVTLEAGSLGAGSSSTGQYVDGGFGGSSSTSPVNIFSGNPIDVRLSYNGTLLREIITDTVTGATFQQGFFVDIPARVGGNMAYVGLTAATRGNNMTEQYFSDLTFSGMPEPSAVFGLILGTVALYRRR
ncbi:MAG: hypothetical protein KDA32_06875 [Phycisphaerales bacterium]|nr:hypothetical protein [Phycisphaerales bacterium]